MTAKSHHNPTQGGEKHTAMQGLMLTIDIKMTKTMIDMTVLATPTMGVMTNPTTTNSSTWSHLYTVRHMLMLMIKAIKNNQGMISGIILGITIKEEGTRSMTTMRITIMDINKDYDNLVKIVDNTINLHQVKQACNPNANTIILLATEDLLLTTIMSEKKACVPAEGT